MCYKFFFRNLAIIFSIYVLHSIFMDHTDAAAIKNVDIKDYGCQCADYSCGCCAHLEAPKIHLNDTGCVNITYLYKEYGISFTMTLDKLTIYNETISARNPPPICFSAPYLEEFADLCVHFYDLNATRSKLHGCVNIEARMHKVVIAKYKVGCFNIGQKSLWYWKNSSELEEFFIKEMHAAEVWYWKNYYTLEKFFIKEMHAAENMLHVSDKWKKIKYIFSFKK